MKYILVFVLVLFGCFSNSPKVPYLSEAYHGVSWEKPKTASKLPSFSLLNQSGKELTTFKGKITVSSFFFTHCPHMCPKTVHDLKSISKKFINSPLVQLASISITPHSDSVSALASFAEEQKIPSAQWNLLTGNKEFISTLADNFFYSPVTLGDSITEPVHSQRVYLTDTEGYLRGTYNSSYETQMNDLSKDIQHLLDEVNNQK